MNTSTKRQQLLDTGVMFAVRYFRDSQRSLKQGLGFLSPTEIADTVGCSRSLIYHLWAVDDATDRGAAFEAYLGDVAEQLSRHLLSVDGLSSTLADVAGDSLDDVVRKVCDQEIRTMQQPDERAMALTDVQLRTIAADSPRIRAAFVAVDHEQRSQLCASYEQLLKEYGREMRPGLELMHLARALWSLSYGVWLESVVEADQVTASVHVDGADWTLYALSVRGVLESLTRPIS